MGMVMGFIEAETGLCPRTDPTAEERALKGFEKDYASIYFAHAIFGACQAWINKGKKESPQEMTDFLLRFIPQ